MTTNLWPYPGSRWWKFDFHTHTPASHDTPWHKQDLTMTERDWLLRYMAAGIDCVVVTDHNSGAWIDRLKNAYTQMKEQPPEGFRELAIFPGVEISVSGGFHLLAIFDPIATTRTITDLLSALRYQGTDGNSDGVTREGPEKVVEEVLNAGGIPVPAHADDEKGLLHCEAGSNKSQLDTNTVRQAIQTKGLLAVEWRNPASPWPECVAEAKSCLARVLGSDCHSFRGENIPGSRYTWVKMAKPTLEGLRLALLDGNGVSIRRSDEGAFDPYKVPAHMITAIEIGNARYMGNGEAAQLTFSPFFNAIIGGRGTGKSTVVHALRLARRRERELENLGGELRERFREFGKVARGRDDKGALRENTEIRLEWRHEEERLRLCWRPDGKSVVEIWQNGQWQASGSQSVNAERFPIRIFSQGQIAAMAGSGRQTLLSIIDEAANVEPLRQAFKEAKDTFFVQHARLRELKNRLAGQAEVERKLKEAGNKLTALSKADHAAVLRAYAQAQREIREMKALFEQLRDDAKRINELSDSIALDDWSDQIFTDTDILAWREGINSQIEQVRMGIQAQAGKLTALVASSQTDDRFIAWHKHAQAAEKAHANLQQQLAAQGVSDPQAFARLTQEKQQLETQQKALLQMQKDKDALAQQIETQCALMAQKRSAITDARKDFIQQTLAKNVHVRIAVIPFGFDPRKIERELRELIEVTDERFADDILTDENGEVSGGMACDLAQANETDKVKAIDSTKQRLLNVDTTLNGHFRNYLQRKHEKPEFADHIRAWFPEDDLRIEYQRGNTWSPISEGSQGQRSAALLAFLLAFGEEPMILDQPEDDLDNHLIYDLVVRQIRENKLRRQFLIVTHNPNVVVNGDAELVHVMEFGQGQCFVRQSGALQESAVRAEVCRVMEGGHEAFARRWKRLGKEI